MGQGWVSSKEEFSIGFARAEQNGTVNVMGRTAGAEGSDFSQNLTFKFLARIAVLRPFRAHIFMLAGIRSYSISFVLFISSYYLFHYFQYFKCKYIHKILAISLSLFA